jgi:hypothetical protein
VRDDSPVTAITDRRGVHNENKPAGFVYFKILVAPSVFRDTEETMEEERGQ